MLPERRKTAEEIAKLREDMGIPGATAAPVETAPGPAASRPEPDDGDAAGEGGEAAPRPAAKAVRSLRKSEQAPVAPAGSAPRENGGAIPARRRSERELMELRRAQATPPDQSIAYIRNLAVPWPLVALGYLLPLGGGLLGWLSVWTPTVMEPDFPAMWMADLSREPWLGSAGLGALLGLCLAGLLLAGWFAWKKPRSRHHAGFIAVIAVLIIVFALVLKFAPAAHGP